MTLADPLPAADFADLIKVASVKWWLQEQQELSGLGSGQVLVADLAPRLWHGTVSLCPMYNDEAAEVQSLVESLDGSLRSFYLYAPQKTYPKADPGGTILGSAAPVIHTIGGDNKTLRIDDLPSSYVLSRGDFLAFDYGSPAKRAFHRVMETAVASSGLTPLMEIRPHLRPGLVTGTAIDLVKPAARVILLPGSFQPGAVRGPITEGMSFDVVQRL